MRQTWVRHSSRAKIAMDGRASSRAPGDARGSSAVPRAMLYYARSVKVACAQSSVSLAVPMPPYRFLTAVTWIGRRGSA